MIRYECLVQFKYNNQYKDSFVTINSQKYWEQKTPDDHIFAFLFATQNDLHLSIVFKYFISCMCIKKCVLSIPISTYVHTTSWFKNIFKQLTIKLPYTTNGIRIKLENQLHFWRKVLAWPDSWWSVIQINVSLRFTVKIIINSYSFKQCSRNQNTGPPVRPVWVSACIIMPTFKHNGFCSLAYVYNQS